MQANHLLTGWHRGIAVDKRVERWLSKRQQAVTDALSTYPGGRNVAQYMQQNGWLDFGPQLLPIRSKPVNWSRLKHYEVILLGPTQQRKIEQGRNQDVYISVGLLDHRLRVTQMLIQTPIMFCNQSQSMCYPWCFTMKSVYRFDDDDHRKRFSRELQRFSHSIKSAILQHIIPAPLLGTGLLSAELLNSNQHLRTKKHEEYPVFREDGCKHSYHRHIAPGDSVVLLIQLKCVTWSHVDIVGGISQWNQTSPLWSTKQLLTVKRQNVDCDFVDEDDDEDDK